MSKYSDSSYTSIYYDITIDGKPLNPFVSTLVEEIVYEDTSTGSDLVSITIHDPDYAIIGDKSIVRSTPCKVVGGFLHDYRTWVNGYISAVDIDFPAEGTPVLTVHVMDKSYIMNRVERKKVYKNVTYKDVASKIAKTYGLAFEGDTSGQGSKKHETITQSYETDIQFLIGLASEIGYLVYVDSGKNKLYFKDKEKYIANKAWATIWYRKPPFDIISFRPRIIQADQLEEIEENDIDNKSKEETKAKSTNDGAKVDGGGGSGSDGGGSSGGSGSNGGSNGGDSSKPQMKYDPYTGKWVQV